MIHYQKKSLLKHFNILQRGTYRGDLHQKYMHEIKDGIFDNQLMALSATYGQGKSTLVEMITEELDKKVSAQGETVNFVYINSQNLERLKISSILNAIIWDLSNESPKNDGEARSRQATRVLGSRFASSMRKRFTCVVIENAHRLHANTLMQLKDFWESKYMGISPLLSILLIGHPELVEKLSRREEVMMRFQIMNLQDDPNWMSFDEKMNYLNSVFGGAIQPKAQEYIAGKADGPLHLELIVRDTMKEAQLVGKKQIDAECVPQTLKERYQNLGVSLAQIGELAHLPKSTVADVVNGQAKTVENINRVQQAIAQLEIQRKNKNSMEAAV